MNVSLLMNEIRQLSLKERFLIMGETLASIKHEDLLLSEKILEKNKNEEADSVVGNDKNYFLLNEPSLAVEWLSDEDNRCDKLI